MMQIGIEFGTPKIYSTFPILEPSCLTIYSAIIQSILKMLSMYVIMMRSLKLGTDYFHRTQHGWLGRQRGMALTHWHKFTYIGPESSSYLSQI